MKTPIRAVTLLVAAAASVALAGTAFAHGKPSGHNKTKTDNRQCDMSAGCGNASQDLNHSLNGNHVNVLSGDLNGDSLLSGNNINAPITIAPDFCGSPLEILTGPQRGVCVGNFHKINAGQYVGEDSDGQGSADTASDSGSSGSGSSDTGSSGSGSSGSGSSDTGSSGSGAPDTGSSGSSGTGPQLPAAPQPQPHPVSQAAVTG